MRTLADDLGMPCSLPAGPLTRVVSLVPSLTEAVAVTRRDALAGATDWCTHPDDLDVPRVRGTKNPDVAAILDLAPQLVIANKEENRERDVLRLREAGIPVWVTVIKDVPQATFYIWLDLTSIQPPLPESANISDGLNFFNALLKEKTIVVPGIFFDLNPAKRRDLFDSPCHHFVRLSYGPRMDVLEKGLDSIQRIVEK